jgi:carbon-monoxide dehydrogenase catalytic subunit
MAGKKFTTIEQMEQEAQILFQKALDAGIDTWQTRTEDQKNHCKFGEDGVCCRNCSMGPCRITPKAPKGICGATAHTIAGRNYLRTTVGGAAAHSDHGREIAHVLYESAKDGNYQVKDEEKCIKIAKEFGIETEGRDIYDIAHDLAYAGLMEYGKPFGYLTFMNRATKSQQELWKKVGIAPRATDREITESMHMTHIGVQADPEALVRQAMRTGLSDGWGGSMMGTDFSDILFGTPMPRETQANLGVLEKDMVNLIVHGHDPAMSEMVVVAAQMPEYVNRARELGAKGINIVGLCCTANEVAMRHGIPMAGNFLQQENAVLTGAVEVIVADVQCIFPALGPLSKCFHTKFITTSPKAKIPDSDFLEFEVGSALETAKKIVSTAVENFVNRKPDRVYIPASKETSVVGYSCEAIIKELDGVTNTQVDLTGTYGPLIECIKAGVLRGAVGIVGCNNPRVRHDYSHIEIMKKMLKNDIIVVVTGCSAQAAAKAGLLSKEAKELCGDGLRRVCDLVGIPPVLHMGSCVDISRIVLLVSQVAREWGIDVTQLPVVGCAPEWMSEKAVSIANYVVGTGLDTYLGIEPQVKGSSEVMHLITDGSRDLIGAGYIIEMDPEKLGDAMIEGIEAKRAALNI